MNKLIYISLVCLIISTTYYDIKENRIPNKVTLLVILIGIILNLVSNSFYGLLFSLTGLIVGLGVFFLPFALGVMGAGDVKLMGAIGALMGWKFTVLVALFSVISGFVVALIYLIYKKKLGSSLKKCAFVIIKPVVTMLYLSSKHEVFTKLKKYIDDNERETKSDQKLYVPYGVAIALGTLFALSGIVGNFIII